MKQLSLKLNVKASLVAICTSLTSASVTQAQATPAPVGSSAHAPKPTDVTGSAFASPAHRRVAEHLRAGRSDGPKVQSQPSEGIPPGTIGMLVRDGNLNPLVGHKVTLQIVRESIAEGNRESTREATTDAEGRAGFVGLNTESAFKYEAVVEKDGARYTSGAFNLRREMGQVIALYVYPVTLELEDTFVVSRALYALQPREDVFQVDAILRFHNAGPKTWAPKDFYVNLPEDASAFRPATTESDLRTRAEGTRVHITGSFTPGQHDLTFGFQLPNPRTSTIRLELPTLPNLVDARVVVEASEQMSVRVEGFEPAEETRGQQGQSALMASRDFLGSGSPAGTTIATIITGMPGRGSGPWIASSIAALFAMFGIAFAVSRQEQGKTTLSQEDRDRARSLLLDELVALEKAFAAQEIGPKTYEQARRTLLDSVARLDSTLA